MPSTPRAANWCDGSRAAFMQGRTINELAQTPEIEIHLMNAQLQPTGSAYFIAKETEKPENHTLSVLVDNEPGVLARVIGLFSGRGYNIESLTVSETEHEKHLSRITIVTRGTPHVLEQIKHQLERIVPVHRVVDLTVMAQELGTGGALARELALVKVAGTGEARVEALRLAEAFRAKVIDANTEHFIFELTGKVSKIEQFIAIMKPLGLVEICRTGVAAMNRGPQGM
ncbi:acetolactate synthase small subunit [Aminobacter sp. AP02]|nr:acetolactate synthase small subunit [Aminobacter sp. AP02]